jgi:Xaa-Pro dipeptidase
MSVIPLGELRERCRRLQQWMAPADLDAIVVVQSADLYYFTGTVQSGTLYLPREGEPVYMVRRDLARAKSESELRSIVPLASMRDIGGILQKHGFSSPKRIGYEFDVLPVSFHERLRKAFGDAESIDAAPIIRKLRSVKSELEIDLIRLAAAQTDRIHRAACRLVRLGMTQIELAAELERVARLEGHPGPLRMRVFNGGMCYGHVIAGADAAIPAHLDTPLGGLGPHTSYGQGASFRKIARGEPIIVDWGGSVNGYLADQTRVLSIGELAGHLARAYDDMRDVQTLMTKLARPGVAWSEIYDRCRALAVEQGHAARFMGREGAQVPFIGHGLGIEIDEPPFIARGFKDVLEPGMVFAFEPKAVFADEGAVGIENTFLLGPEGVEKLTFSDEAIAIVDDS